MDEKWKEVTSKINAFGANEPLNVKQVKKKWFDIKSKAKKAVSHYEADMKRTGGGTSQAQKPTEMQYRIAQVMGQTNITGIPGTESCDTGHPLSTPPEVCPASPTDLSSLLGTVNNHNDLCSPAFTDLMPPSPQLIAPVTSDDGENCSGILALPIRRTHATSSDEEPPPKRKRKVQQSKQIIEIQKNLTSAVQNLETTLKAGCDVTNGMFAEMQKANSLQDSKIALLQEQITAQNYYLQLLYSVLTAKYSV